MIVLVTGVAGFLGSHIADRLIVSGNQVIGLDDLSGGVISNIPKGVQFTLGSVRDEPLVEDLFRRFQPQVVIHAAAYAAENLSHFVKKFNYETNLLGSVVVLNAALRHRIKLFIFTSSIAVYGNAPSPMRETMTPHPEDPYGISKYAFELELQASAAMFGLPHVIFRPHNVYGERQNVSDPYRNVVGIFIRQVLSGEPLTVFGDGMQTRAFSHVDAVSAAIADSLTMPDCWMQTFNLGSDDICNVGELARIVSKAARVPLRIEYRPERHEVRHAFSDHNKLHSFFGKQASIPLEEGVSRMLAWVRATGIPTMTQGPPIELAYDLRPARNQEAPPIPHGKAMPQTDS